jgi:hypothetical protein
MARITCRRALGKRLQIQGLATSKPFFSFLCKAPVFAPVVILCLLVSCYRRQDWPAEEICTCEKRPFSIAVPIVWFSAIQTPCIQVTVEGITVPMEVDLGFGGTVTAAPEFVALIRSKQSIGERTTYGIKGNRYTKKLYQIPKLSIGRMIFSSSVLEEEEPIFLKESTFTKNGEEPSSSLPGRIGWELFQNTKILIDIKGQQIVFCNSIDTLKRKNFSVGDFVRVPLLLERGLVEVEVVASGRPLRCVLDTGATWNFFNVEMTENVSVEKALWEPENVVALSPFEIAGIDFGVISFHRIPIRIPIHVEAILGIEFFKSHMVFLDFEKKWAYFSKS